MKRLNTLLLFCISLLSLPLFAQRYISEVFEEVQVTSDIEYGINATALWFPAIGELVPESLQLDFYEPLGDTESERPLVLVFHDGAFLPPCYNGRFVEGSRTDSAVVEICTQLARRGFVAAAVSYRLGWNPFAAILQERDLTLIQAMYRSMQDGFTAIRFFQKAHANGNAYGIDPKRIACWGIGWGGYLPLMMVGLDDYDELLMTSHPPGKFFYDLDGDLIPEPMVDPEYHGDIFGESLTIIPDNLYGFPQGDTSNMANHVGYPNRFHLAIHIGAAMPDISWLRDQSVPILSIQSIKDELFPYFDSPFSPVFYNTFPQQGLQMIGSDQESSGINQPWKDLQLNDPVTQDAMANSATAGHPYYEGSYSWAKPANSIGIDEGVVTAWWDSTQVLDCMSFGGLPINQAMHPSGLGTIHEYLLLTNENMSAEKARANIADIMAFVIPRACVTLDLGCPTVTVVWDFQLPHDLIEVAPNPANGYVTLSVTDNRPIQGIEIFNMEGKLISRTAEIKEAQQTVGLSGFTPGLYVMKVFLEDGFAVKKLMVK